MAPRRERVDSTSSAVRVARRAQEAISPPRDVPLDKADLPFFANILAMKAKADWKPHEIEVAATLARVMADLIADRTAYREEGSLVVNGKGGVMSNPRLQAMRDHAALLISLRKTLGLDARAAGDGRDVAKQREGARKVEADAADALDDELFARPN